MGDLTASGVPVAEARRMARLGRRYPDYTTLPAVAERVAARVAALEAEHGRPVSVGERR